MASVVITDYLRAIYGENSLIDGRKRRAGGERSGEDMERKEGELVEGEGE